MKKVSLYLRVSTADQNLELQQTELEKFALDRDWKISEIYSEKKSGASMFRPVLQELLHDARLGQFNVLMVWKLDRIARSLKDLITLLCEFKELGIEFISIKDQLDLSTPSGKLMLHLIGAFAEFEASLIRERVKAGLENAKRKGVKLGRRPTIDTARVFELRRAGLSLAQIARRLSISRSGVHKTLANEQLKIVHKC